MEKRYPKFLLFRGELVPYGEARIHVLSTAVKFATTVFEGLRGYWNEDRQELYCFRLTEHFRRLSESMEIVRIPGPNEASWYIEQVVRIIRANEFREDLHIRVQVFIDADDGGLSSTEPTSVCIAAMPMGRYLKHDGVDVAVSSWARIWDRSTPPRAKAVANYHNSRLAVVQARIDGYDDAILLTPDGRVAEGPGYNLFLVRRGQLITPPVTEGVLEGITRDSLIRLAHDMLGIDVVERPVDRSELYVAEEMFFCGSAAEVTPILSVDRHKVGTGGVGDITNRLKVAYLAAARGLVPGCVGWLTPVYVTGADGI